ncbi:uncharacterized protein SCO4629-like [Ylistrum balloti]|uniref:uncharacterized protein SCO4629-like n=1 Tax=Ylistrum balloti TaxID=509963 RepID=UPI002905AF12|nr:uncharacterized protein SCO4629-like [Ylistrum balloti]
MALTQWKVHLVIFFLSSVLTPLSTNATYDRENDTCRLIPENHIRDALTVWKFLRVNDKLQKSDLILGLGSHDKRVAMEASRLWLNGYGDFLMFSGKSGNLTRGRWRKSEAEIFRDVAVSLGVPENKILTEENSQNTGENFKYSYKLLKRNDKIPKTLIIVQKPHMGLRTVATFKKQWPGNQAEVALMVTSPNISLLDYPNDDVGDLEDVISVLIGYLQRIKVYGETGFQSYHYLPRIVWDAFVRLKSSTLYSSHLLKDTCDR